MRQKTTTNARSSIAATGAGSVAAAVDRKPQCHATEGAHDAEARDDETEGLQTTLRAPTTLVSVPFHLQQIVHQVFSGASFTIPATLPESFQKLRVVPTRPL